MTQTTPKKAWKITKKKRGTDRKSESTTIATVRVTKAHARHLPSTLGLSSRACGEYGVEVLDLKGSLGFMLAIERCAAPHTRHRDLCERSTASHSTAQHSIGSKITLKVGTNGLRRHARKSASATRSACLAFVQLILGAFGNLESCF